MTSYLIGLSASAITSLTAFGLVLWFFDPTTTGDIGLTLFLLTLFFSILSLGSALIFYIKLRQKTIDQDSIWQIIRQVGMVALATTGLIALQIFRLYHWWYILIALIIILSVEFYIRVKVE